MRIFRSFLRGNGCRRRIRFTFRHRVVFVEVNWNDSLDCLSTRSFYTSLLRSFVRSRRILGRRKFLLFFRCTGFLDKRFKSAEESIEIDQFRAVVAFEGRVVKVVEARASCRFVVAVVSADRRDVRVELRVEKVKRMTSEEKRKIGTGVVEEMFHRVHRQA